MLLNQKFPKYPSGVVLKNKINEQTFAEILSNHNLAKFGDSLVNFLYNVSVYKSTQKLNGIKVWDQCLADALKNSPLRKFAGSRKKKGELADATEAFLAYCYIRDENKFTDMINILTQYITLSKLSKPEKEEKEMCSLIFSKLLNELCEKMNIK